MKQFSIRQNGLCSNLKLMSWYTCLPNLCQMVMGKYWSAQEEVQPLCFSWENNAPNLSTIISHVTLLGIWISHFKINFVVKFTRNASNEIINPKMKGGISHHHNFVSCHFQRQYCILKPNTKIRCIALRSSVMLLTAIIHLDQPILLCRSRQSLPRSQR